MNERKPLTISETLALGTVVNMAVHGQHVARLLDNGDITQGTARSIGDRNGGYSGPDDDIRDMYLRVTTDSGFEAFWPVSELVEDVKASTFMEYAR